jgi:hypothetical protein
MSAIVEFLEARIAEDEERAAKVDWCPYNQRDVTDEDWAGVHWTTARVLAECKAKRALIQAVPKWHERNEGDAYYSCPQTQFETLPANAWRDGDYPGAATTPGSDLTDEECNCGLEYRRMAILGPLASVYADHPDFDASWNA